MIIAAADRIGRSQVPIWHRAGDVPQDLGSTVVTLGVFDGMHHGHAHLVGRAVAAARERRLPAVLVTFDPHPAAVLGLPKDHARLSSVERRAELAGRLGIDAVFVVDFTAQFARQSPQCFVDELLVRTLRARAVVLGSNFTFGHRGAGTVDTMRTLGRVAGFTTEMVELAGHRDVVSSSSRVRACLRRGDLDGAARVLGRPHRIEGRLDPVELYDAAFVPASGSAVPGPGWYAARLVGGDGRCWPRCRRARAGRCSRSRT